MKKILHLIEFLIVTVFLFLSNYEKHSWKERKLFFIARLKGTIIILSGRKPRINLDQDDVQAECLPELLAMYNKEHNTNLTREDIPHWNIEEILGEGTLNYFKDKDFFYRLKPVEGFTEVFRRMYESDLFDFRTVTAGKSQCHYDKTRWIKEQAPFFPEENIIFCMDKGSVWGDILLDDAIHNIKEFKNSCFPKGLGIPIIFDRPLNRCLTNEIRVKDWYEFEKVISSIFYPKTVFAKQEISELSESRIRGWI